MTLITLVLGVVILGPNLLEISNNNLPDLLMEAGQPAYAEKYLQTVIRWQPDSAILYGNLGDILVLERKNPQAIAAYQQAIAQDEYLPRIHNNLGVLYLDSGEVEKSVDHFLQALHLNPQSTDTYRNLGNAYIALEQWEAAANAYQYALDIDASLLDIQTVQAGLLLYNGQLEKARQAWEAVLLEEPRNKLALQGLGLVALLEEDPVLALLYLDAARYLAPEDTLTSIYTGLALEALDMPEEAGAEYQNVLKVESDPDLRGLAYTLLEVVKD